MFSRYLTVKACCAPDAADDCRRNAAASLDVLRRYGIDNITSAHQEWWLNGDTYAVLLEDRISGEPLGGVRLQRWGNGVPLALEDALGGVDARVHDWIAGFAGGGVGELCGLWCGRALRGFGMGARLTSMGIALSAQAQTDTLFGLCDTRNVEANLGLGFRVDGALAARGAFEYPRPGLFAHVLRLDGARRRPGATPAAQATIGHYRDVPVGVEIIAGELGSLQLHRDLVLVDRAQARRMTAT
jgi:hypothetical protein